MRTKIGFGLLFAALVWAQTAPTAGTPTTLPPGLYAVIHTSMGTITAELFEKETPNTVRNFIGLARGTRPWLDPKTRKATTRPLYEDITFHRVIPDFMIQTGDPTGTGAHNCGFVLKDEIVRGLKFDRPGRLGMANIGQPNTGACQFFITEKPFPMGNGMYTIFGQVVEGMDLIGQIARVKRDGNDKPKTPVMLNKVDIIRVVLKSAPASAVRGSGLYVNESGDILTTSEFVTGCSEVHLGDGKKIEMITGDRQNGLAVLHSGNKAATFAVFRAGDAVAPEEPVWTTGPEPSVVSATADGHGDNRYLQMTGALQPAAKGGPVLDTSGNVTGILFGNGQAENSTLAIKASVAMGFLDSVGVAYTAKPSEAAANRTAATANAQQYTVEIQCWK